MKCPVCQSKALPQTVGAYTRCPVCLCRFVAHPPSTKSLQQASDKWGVAHARTTGNTTPAPTDFERLDRLTPYLKQRATILDVGCGMGTFVYAAKSQGYAVRGMDISRPVIRFLKTHHIPAVSRMSAVKGGSVDAVVSFDVIEHIADPHAFLSGIYRVLKPGGICMISTPNAAGLSAKVLGYGWWVFGPHDHIRMYSVPTLIRLFAMHGFRIVGFRTDTLTPWAYPPDSLTHRLVNKIVYTALRPWLPALYHAHRGDNIECIITRS